MKAAVLIAPDWPGDEVVFVFDDAAETAAHHVLAEALDATVIKDRAVAVLDRQAFRRLEQKITALVARDGRAGVAAPAWLKAFDARLDRLGRQLAMLRADDRSGDPRPGTPLHAAMAADLAEAGR